MEAGVGEGREGTGTEGLPRVVGMLEVMEEGCEEFLLYLEHCQGELLRRSGDWRAWGQVMETRE